MILIRPCIPVFRWYTGTTYITLESDDCRFAVSHIVTHYYATSHWVAWTVGLAVALSVCRPCKNGSNDQVAICVPDSGGPNETLINMPTWEGAILRRNRQTIVIVKYIDTPRSSVQRRLNQSRCHLGCGLVWPKASCVTWEVQIPMGSGNSGG